MSGCENRSGVGNCRRSNQPKSRDFPTMASNPQKREEGWFNSIVGCWNQVSCLADEGSERECSKFKGARKR